MLSSTQETTLPRQIDPRKFAQKGIAVTGSIAQRELPRLAEFLVDQNGVVDVDLQFYVDEQGARVLDGRLSAEVKLVCQRCLEPMIQPVKATIALNMVWDDEQAKQVDKSRDAWVLPEGQTDIYHVIEEELLLSIPLVSYHEELCIPAEHYNTGDIAAVDQQPKQNNPFQALASMKAQLSNDKPDT